LSLPNYITLFRLAITPFFFTALVSYEPGKEGTLLTALILFAIAAFSDALDGLLARVLKQTTPLGKFLDPLADKFLLLSGYLGLLFAEGLHYTPPLWITVTIVFRDIVILVGLVMIYLFSGTIEVRPNFLGKCTSALQMVTILAILLQHQFSPFLWTLTAIFTILSGVIYCARELRKIQEPAE